VKPCMPNGVTGLLQNNLALNGLNRSDNCFLKELEKNISSGQSNPYLCPSGKVISCCLILRNLHLNPCEDSFGQLLSRRIRFELSHLFSMQVHVARAGDRLYGTCWWRGFFQIITNKFNWKFGLQTNVQYHSIEKEDLKLSRNYMAITDKAWDI